MWIHTYCGTHTSCSHVHVPELRRRDCEQPFCPRVRVLFNSKECFSFLLHAEQRSLIATRGQIPRFKRERGKSDEKFLWFYVWSGTPEASKCVSYYDDYLWSENDSTLLLLLELARNMHGRFRAQSDLHNRITGDGYNGLRDCEFWVGQCGWYRRITRRKSSPFHVKRRD